MPSGVFQRRTVKCELCEEAVDHTRMKPHLRRHALGGTCHRCRCSFANLVAHEVKCPARSVDALLLYGKVERTEAGCLEWRGPTFSSGYARVGNARANRVVLELSAGAPLGELEACHSCDNKLCVNAEHLWPGTQLDNMRDMIKKGRKVVLVGDQNPMRDPGRRAAMSGENHWTRRYPDRVTSGDQHWARKYPEKWRAAMQQGKTTTKENQ